MVSHSQTGQAHFPRQVGSMTLDFEEWAIRVKQQMLTSLQEKRKDSPKDC
jgi:hypothetical protein